MIEFSNARLYTFDPARRSYERKSGFAVEGDRVAGWRDPVGVGVRRVDLAGATVVPAFADCHVHVTDTGLLAGERDLLDVRDFPSFERRVAALAPESGFLYGGNYDEMLWHDGKEATAAILESAHAGSVGLVARVDGHSCVVNRAAMQSLDLDLNLPGVERDAAGAPTGRLFVEANRVAQQRFFDVLPEPMRRSAEKRAAAMALAAGALYLHVQLVGFGDLDGYAGEIEALRAAGPIKWYPKICERKPVIAHSLGLKFVGGDVFLDGSLGSGTAALRAPYHDRASDGHLAVSNADLHAYFAEAEALGVSAGVHAIGDRAIEQCISTWEEVLRSKPSPRNRHFIEHFEVASPDQIARCARLGIFLSMQPQFDASWGGDGGMYERRLGRERARSMNAFRTALDAGATLCGGDDSPVCALSPLLGMAAACGHHVESERLTPLEALTMYTYDAARLAHAEAGTGTLAPGFAADFLVLDRDPFEDGDFANTRVLQTWSNGTCVYDRDGAAA